MPSANDLRSLGNSSYRWSDLFAVDGSFSGNVSIAGTLTYEDVTNVDSVGVVTARSGVLVGSGITLSPDGDIFAVGVSTFTGAIDANDNLVVAGDMVIGSDTAQAKLDVTAGGVHNAAFLKTSSDKSLIEFENSAGSTYNTRIGSATLGSGNVGLLFETGTHGSRLQAMVVDRYGKVGIGSVLPAAKLDVAGSFNVSNIVNIGAASPTTSDNGQLNVYTTTSGGKAQFVHGAGFGGVRLAGTAAASGASLVFSNNYNSGTFSDHWTIQHGGSDDSLKFLIGGTGGTEAFRIESNGKVGISSDSPTAKLDVNGDVRVGSGISLSPDGDIFSVGVTTFRDTVRFEGANGARFINYFNFGRLQFNNNASASF